MQFLNKQEYSFSNLRENIELTIYSFLAFFIPFFLHQNQLFVGIIVNMTLVLAAINLKSWKILPLIVLPSAAVLSRGLLFGSLTPFLLYMMPFIWIGNILLIIFIKKLYVENKFLSLVIGAISKAGFLFMVAFLFVNINLLPVLFLTSMGLVQFYTAITGGLLAFSINHVKNKLTQ
ncbi:MAG: hypothetical protein ACMXX8_03180 [Candidatus Woesearchaeota archaeon]